MAKKMIDINVDMGESFGNYTFGNDAEIMKYITSANVACGFHGGDPVVMRKTVLLAKENNVAVGAHMGYPDLLGFGRRIMEVSAEECEDYVIYQLGALKAFAEAYGLKLQHANIHGALFSYANKNDGIAKAIVDGIKKVDLSLYFVSRPGLRSYEMAKGVGLRVKTSIAVDMTYTKDGMPIIERQKKSVGSADVAKRVLMLLNEGRIEAVDGGYYKIDPDTLLVHGDNPNVVDILKMMRSELDKAGIKVTSFQKGA